MKRHKYFNICNSMSSTLAASAQSALFKIPREVRDEILSFVLLSRYPVPQTPEEIEEQERQVPVALREHYREGLYYICDETAYTSNALSLLLTNKQLHAETRDALERLDIPFELDIKFVNDRYLAPTWTSIPTKTQHFKHLRTVFQSIGEWQKPPQESKFSMIDIWSTGCGGPPGYVWIFYDTLVHFLKYGPAPPESTGSPQLFSVECLELDFVDPEDVGLLPSPESRRHLWALRSRHNAGQEPKVLRPEWLAEDLRDQLMSLFGMDYYTAEYGRILHGRIGRVVFKANGQMVHEIDVGQVLAGLKFEDSFGNYQREHRAETWIQWKEQAQELRKRRGLHTVEFSKGWQKEARDWAAEYYASKRR
ncbi:hypothetical protein N0V90_006860 [Kalmusia sp. IMI 367209]|nr:hypothetical protein N0V90_006860 [Kalmusia sp. IMI 367209]